jgi:hypothetical protein
MAKRRMRWIARMGYTVGNFPGVKFVGREPFAPSGESHKKALLALGVFEDLGDGRIRYSAPIKVWLNDGTKVFIDNNGIVEYDRDMLDQEHRAIEKEMIPADDAIPTYHTLKAEAERQR